MCYRSKTYPSFLTVKEGFFLPLRLSCKESSTFLTKPLFNGLYTPFGSPVCGGQKPQEREDVAGDAIALPEFWSASGACALKGWLRVLTQQSCDCLSPSGRLYSGCSCRYFSIQGFNSGISHSIVSQRLSGSTV